MPFFVNSSCFFVKESKNNCVNAQSKSKEEVVSKREMASNSWLSAWKTFNSFVSTALQSFVKIIQNFRSVSGVLLKDAWEKWDWKIVSTSFIWYAFRHTYTSDFVMRTRNLFAHFWLLTAIWVVLLGCSGSKIVNIQKVIKKLKLEESKQAVEEANEKKVPRDLVVLYSLWISFLYFIYVNL